MTLTDRLTRINANRAILQARIDRKRLRREAISYDHAALVRETLAEIRLKIRLEKKGVA